eukprot:TRINITY_DN23335_c0_g4_i1.p1 TRINITY_DN23335_c0_g4~~TRINITY_DN23335_c0_g4_i1.p1  ORF type:complete len:359 (-),score=48.54 TRINITY_DN23335_c0_g4_i1:129-1163(-)
MAFRQVALWICLCTSAPLRFCRSERIPPAGRKASSRKPASVVTKGRHVLERATRSVEPIVSPTVSLSYLGMSEKSPHVVADTIPGVARCVNAFVTITKVLIATNISDIQDFGKKYNFDFDAFNKVAGAGCADCGSRAENIVYKHAFDARRLIWSVVAEMLGVSILAPTNSMNFYEYRLQDELNVTFCDAGLQEKVSALDEHLRAMMYDIELRYRDAKKNRYKNDKRVKIFIDWKGEIVNGYRMEAIQRRRQEKDAGVVSRMSGFIDAKLGQDGAKILEAAVWFSYAIWSHSIGTAYNSCSVVDTAMDLVAKTLSAFRKCHAIKRFFESIQLTIDTAQVDVPIHS